jgi:hypothetical protein
MPEHPSFKKIHDNMIAQYGKEKGDGVYYAWLQKHNLDDTKSAPSEIPGGKKREDWRERVENLYEKRLSEVLQEGAMYDEYDDVPSGLFVKTGGSYHPKLKPFKSVITKDFRSKEPVERDAIGRAILYDQSGKEVGRAPEHPDLYYEEAVKTRGPGRPRKFKSFRVTKRIERIAEQMTQKTASKESIYREEEETPRKKVGPGTYWQGYLSITGNPAGEFTNEQGKVIGYSSYDKITKIMPDATPWLKREYEKHKESVTDDEKQQKIKQLLKDRDRFKAQGREDDVWMVNDYLKDLGHKEDISMATGGGTTATMLPGAGKKQESGMSKCANCGMLFSGDGEICNQCAHKTREAKGEQSMTYCHDCKTPIPRKDAKAIAVNGTYQDFCKHCAPKNESAADDTMKKLNQSKDDTKGLVPTHDWRSKAERIHKKVEGAKARREFLKERFEKIARRISEAELALERQEARGNTSAAIKHRHKLESLYKEMTLLSESHIDCSSQWHASEVARLLKGESVDAEVKGDKVYFPKSQEGTVIQALQRLKNVTPVIHQERATVFVNGEGLTVTVRSQAPSSAWNLITSTLKEAYPGKSAEQVRQAAGHIWFKWMPKRGVTMERLNKEAVLRAAKESGFGGWKNRLERLHESIAPVEDNVNDPEEQGLPKLRVDSEVPDAGNRTVANLEAMSSNTMKAQLQALFKKHGLQEKDITIREEQQADGTRIIAILADQTGKSQAQYATPSSHGAEDLRLLAQKNGWWIEWDFPGRVIMGKDS